MRNSPFRNHALDHIYPNGEKPANGLIYRRWRDTPESNKVIAEAERLAKVENPRVGKNFSNSVAYNQHINDALVNFEAAQKARLVEPIKQNPLGLGENYYRYRPYVRNPLAGAAKASLTFGAGGFLTDLAIAAAKNKFFPQPPPDPRRYDATGSEDQVFGY